MAPWVDNPGEFADTADERRPKRGNPLRPAGVIAVLVSISSTLWLAPPALAAVKCGAEGPDSKVATGQLELNAATSTTNLDFEGGTARDGFVVDLKVSGCSLNDARGIATDVRVAGPAREALGGVVLRPRGTLLTAEIPVEPQRFPTRSYKPILTLSSPREVVATTQIALTMQRKQPPLVPALIALGAFLAGCWRALYVARTTMQDKLKPGQQIEFKNRHRTAAIVGALIGAVPAFVSIYVTPGSWTLDVGSVLALLIAVAAAAVGGATAGAGAAYAVSTKT